MARPVYSYLFSVNTLAPGGHEDIVLDALFTYVVRDITCFLSPLSDFPIRLQISVLGDTLWDFCVSGQPAAARSWQGHVVVPGAFDVTVDVAGFSGYVNYAISGYKLSAS
jgi:hypothetical protein